MTSTPAVAELDLDLWTEEAILDPHPLWRQLRDAGPVVRIPSYDLWALPRFLEVKEALANWEVFSSAEGVTLNETMNEAQRGILLCSDPPEHDHLREIIRRPL